MKALHESIVAISAWGISLAVINEYLQTAVLVIGLAAGIHAFISQLKNPKPPKQ